MRNGPMRKTLDSVADRLLGLFVPHGEASAAVCGPAVCSCFMRDCYCSGGYLYAKYCDGGCNGIPVFCGTCKAIGRC